MRKMKKLLFVFFAGLVFSLMLGKVDFANAQNESEEYKIKHLATLKQKSGFNYYSYNFVAVPGENTIDSIKIAIISDIETHYVTTETDISKPFWISFGIMIHANDLENIQTEVVDIKLKN